MSASRNVILIDPKDLGDDGFYQIDAIRTNVHEVIINDDIVNVAIVHNAPRPDYTLQTWVSNVPNGQPNELVPRPARRLSVPRRAFIWTFGADDLPKPDTEGNSLVLNLPRGKYFLNVENRENTTNGYNLYISRINRTTPDC